MKNIEISSPETDRKIARPASIIFMCVIWVFMVFGLAWYLVAKFHHQPAIWSNTDWQSDDYIFVGIFSATVVFIPVQVIRYFRRKRA